MSGIRKLIQGAGIYIGTSVINAAIPFLLLPILTRYLSPEEYGEVALFTVWTALAGALCGLTVHGAANRKFFDFDKDRDMGEFIFSCVLILGVSATACFILAFILSDLISQLLNFPIKWILLGVVFAANQFLIQLRLGQWRVRERPIAFGVFQIMQSVFNLALSLLLVVLFELGASGRIWAQFIAVLVFAILGLMLLYKEKLLVVAWRPQMIKEALRFGVPLIPHTIGAFLLLSVDRAVISAILGINDAGIYMVAVQFGMIVALVLDAVNRALSPWLYKHLKLNDLATAQKVVKVTYSLYGFLFIGAFLAFAIAEEVVLLVVGPEFSQAADIVAWVMLGQFIRGCYLFVANYIFFKKRTEFISAITITSGLLNVALLYFFVDSYGAVGAAYALSVSMTFQWLATWLISMRLVKMPWFNFQKKFRGPNEK